MSILSMLGPLSWFMAWLMFRCETIWSERDEIFNWIAAIFVAGMAEGFWGGVSLKDENLNCDPGYLVVGRLCNDEKDTIVARVAIRRVCNKICCTNCKKVVAKACMWFAKDKKDRIRPEHIVDIIVKASLMEAAIYV